MRGNPPQLGHRKVVGRSIPACAGEPSGLPAAKRRPGVYPRVCGGTGLGLSFPYASPGLSPRVRGNRRPPSWTALLTRSIPACAGEPGNAGAGGRQRKVYPRVCGGTFKRLVRRIETVGLSPRVRGNPLPTRAPGETVGSIPACAGEPACRSSASAFSRVYPRVCGGTFKRLVRRIETVGLSPRVRGNHARRWNQCGWIGSIPACAGEPIQRTGNPAYAPVYPRVCGGTVKYSPPLRSIGGLSPRVRGNLPAHTVSEDGIGSIPACAGEPAAGRPARGRHRVYPRVCGGTRPDSKNGNPGGGLSPRVRGNRSDRDFRKDYVRSIPACAGEPTPPGHGSDRRTVYPRVCGGTPPRGL